MEFVAGVGGVIYGGGGLHLVTVVRRGANVTGEATFLNGGLHGCVAGLGLIVVHQGGAVDRIGLHVVHAAESPKHLLDPSGAQGILHIAHI
jgi:hypothetical protein